PFAGASAGRATAPRASLPPQPRRARSGTAKLLPSLRAAVEACELEDGATVSFHHHLRNGDAVLCAVMAEIAALGLRDIRLAPSALFPVHAPLVEHIRNGVVTGIATAYMAGPVADAVARGWLATPAVLQTHGGRARAIESGALAIDAAFVAAPTADSEGNLNGAAGRSACGPLGYPMVDVAHARRVVAIADNLVPCPAAPLEISGEAVDYVVQVDSIGDARQIVSGITRVTGEPAGLGIAAAAARAIEASGLLEEGFSFQTGAGGISLAVAAALGKVMAARGVVGSFASGGITGPIVELFHAGLFRALFDVQCFDLEAVESYRRDEAHRAISASRYASPDNGHAVVERLDAVALGAAEVDLDFNVNVTLGADGRIIGGSGGHSDTAAGAKLALVTTRLGAGAHPKIVERVACVTTPGETIDAVVTEEGIAVNPRRPELRERLAAAGLAPVSIEELRDKAERRAGGVAGERRVARESRAGTARIVAVAEYRDGTVIDVVEGVE
ncbi:MAG: citrate lyase subunit alpha, partial [Kiloniellales bacterium]